jgi:heat shock protein HslJ
MSAMLVACTSTKNVGNNSEPAGIASVEWRLVSVVSETGILTVENAVKHAVMKIEADGKVHGDGGCNLFSGISVIKGTNIKFDKILVTQKACFDMKIETAFFAVLGDADSFAVESGDLKLKKGDAVLATFSTFR